MNLLSISTSIAEEFNLSKAESRRIVKHIISEISEDLSAGERVYFRGFGAFHRITRPEKKYRNIKTGKIETKPAYNDVRFNPSSQLKDLVK